MVLLKKESRCADISAHRLSFFIFCLFFTVVLFRCSCLFFTVVLFRYSCLFSQSSCFGTVVCFSQSPVPAQSSVFRSHLFRHSRLFFTASVPAQASVLLKSSSHHFFSGEGSASSEQYLRQRRAAMMPAAMTHMFLMKRMWMMVLSYM